MLTMTFEVGRVDLIVPILLMTEWRHRDAKEFFIPTQVGNTRLYSRTKSHPEESPLQSFFTYILVLVDQLDENLFLNWWN